MKKFGVSLLVILMAMGLMVAFSGCGDNGDDNGLPKSDAAYAGSGDDADLSEYGYAFFAEELPQWIMDPRLPELYDDASGSGNYSDVLDGTENGTVTLSGEYRWEETESTEYEEWEDRMVFDNYVDDGYTLYYYGDYPYVTEGDGSVFSYGEYRASYPEGNGVAGLVAEGYDAEGAEHMNFSDLSVTLAEGLYLAEANNTMLDMSGWLHREGFGRYEDSWTCQQVQEADYSFARAYTPFSEEYYFGLNATSTVSYIETQDSEATWKASGTRCVEGPFQQADVNGCIEFEIDVTFADAYTDGGDFCSPDGFPTGGTAEYWSGDAHMMVAYGSSDSNPECYDVKLDLNGDGDYEDEFEYDLKDQGCEIEAR